MSDRAYIGALVAIAALVVAGLLLSRPAPTDKQEDEPASLDARGTARSTTSARPAPRWHAEDGAPTQEPLDPASPTTHAGPRPDSDAGPPDVGPSQAALGPADAGAEGEPAWADPVNARVLGPTRWMAPDDEAEEARIDEVFERARAARHDPRISNRARATSIGAAREIVDRCFELLQGRVPGATGRIIVAWRAESRGGTGFIVEPRVTTNVGLRDAQFESCIVDGLRDQTFGPADGESIEVEAPFFYDGSF